MEKGIRSVRQVWRFRNEQDEKGNYVTSDQELNSLCYHLNKTQGSALYILVISLLYQRVFRQILKSEDWRIMEFRLFEYVKIESTVQGPITPMELAIVEKLASLTKE